MKLPLPRWKKHKPAVATHSPVKKTTAKHKVAAIPVRLGAHTAASSAPLPAAALTAANLAREKEAAELKRRTTEAKAEAEVDLSAVLPDTARAAHHDCNDRDAWLAEHAYLVRLRPAATAFAASPMQGVDACTTTTTTPIMSLSPPRRQIDDAPPY